MRRFHAEAAAAAKLTHPNVVPIYFIGEDAGHHFFAMQYVEGESLADLLARRGNSSVGETLAIIEQVLAGLAAAHAQGLVHRDIKPANILLDAATTPALLVDFGLVKRIAGGDNKTATGIIMGTVDYLSPEQGRGKPVDARSDLYSVGVLLYRMLSGRLPFTADSPTAMIFQHVYEPPVPLTHVSARHARAAGGDREPAAGQDAGGPLPDGGRGARRAAGIPRRRGNRGAWGAAGSQCRPAFGLRQPCGARRP